MSTSDRGAANTVLVTGAAGFIGSRLVGRLEADGRSVRGIDCFTDFYDVGLKRQRIERLVSPIENIDLRSGDLGRVLSGVGAVVHLAGQPGVRPSWGSGFADYVGHNISATQRLLEACASAGVRRFVGASSSSIYGALRHPFTDEATLPAPVSPYGVTKLAAEHLTSLYGTERGIETVSLRFFSVYGPGQRPDMAIARLIDCARSGEPFPRFGDGTQRRDLTFVDDVVDVVLRSLAADLPAGTVLNVGGGESVSLNDMIEAVERLTGADLSIDSRPRAAGDVDITSADCTLADRLLGWRPSVGFRDGIAAQVADSLDAETSHPSAASMPTPHGDRA